MRYITFISTNFIADWCVFRYDDLWSAQDPKLVWHIDPAAGLKDLDTNYSAINDYVVNAEPWQAAVNGIY